MDSGGRGTFERGDRSGRYAISRKRSASSHQSRLLVESLTHLVSCAEEKPRTGMKKSELSKLAV